MLDLPLIQTRVALRNILRHRRRSGLTVLAVAFGIFCLIVFQALKSGLHEKMMESSLGLDLGSLQIHAAGYETNMPFLQPLPAPATILAALAARDLRRQATERVKTTGLILAGRHSTSVVLSGIEPAQEQNVTFIQRKIVAGTADLGQRRILVGKVLAERLGLAVGDTVDILVQDSFGQPARARLTVAGLFASGLSLFDQSHAYLAIADAREILDTEADAVTEIALAVAPPQVEAIALALRGDLAGSGCRVRTFRELAPDLVQLIELNDATFRLLILIVFAIVAMGIANTMTTVIFERFRELGTMAALGTTPLQIVLLITTESALLGLIAALCGSCAAILACQWLALHGLDLAHFTSSNQYFAAGSLLKARLGLADLLTANVIALLTALTAGISPAIKAARMHPVEALRST